jgi:hypothetical protein
VPRAKAQQSINSPSTQNYNPKQEYDIATTISIDKELTQKGTDDVACEARTRIKGSGAAVYYCGDDGKRYVFPTSSTYFTWYQDFSGVVTLSDADLARIPIGGNVTYRPGTRLIKIVSSPQVYAVSRGGQLRQIPNEQIAILLFGTNWSKLVDDLPEGFFTDYKIGATIK